MLLQPPQAIPAGMLNHYDFVYPYPTSQYNIPLKDIYLGLER